MGRENVLIAHADERMAYTAGADLIRSGFSVTFAGDALQAIRSVRESAPDIAVLGLGLPGGGGKRVRDVLRAVGGVATKLVYLGDGRTPAPDDGLHIRRPYRADDIVGAVMQAVTPKRSGSGVTRILVVEDDEDQARLIRSMIEQKGGTEVTHARTCREAGERVASMRFDCVIVDEGLPDGTGSDFIRDHEDDLLTSVVIGLSAEDDPRVALNAFRQGCVEFLDKKLVFRDRDLRARLDESLARIRRRLLAAMVTDRQLNTLGDQTQEALIKEARTDRLTGLANRAVFDDLHADLHKRALEKGVEYGLVLVDIDRFKRYNDRHGHAEGDTVLRAAALALREASRPSDLVARVGGEEFGVLTEDTDIVAVSRIAERLREAVFDLRIPHVLNGAYGIVTASLGATIASGSDETGRAVYERADGALYAAKDGGRNRVQVTRPDALRKSA